MVSQTLLSVALCIQRLSGFVFAVANCHVSIHCHCYLQRTAVIKKLSVVDSSWNVMAHGDAWEGKWREKWRMQWVASTLHTTSEHDVSSITTADAHTSAASSRLNWRPPADLNGLVRFAERRNVVSARMPSYFKRSLPIRALMGPRAGLAPSETRRMMPCSSSL